MSKQNSKVIDFLYEDPPIPNQKFALISIVGPHMPQKCDVWGLKVRGIADSSQKAKEMAQKLMRIDNIYDVYTVEVGKFFPIVVEPDAIKDVEYQNSQLNELVKTYMENRELANEHWNKRKNDMIKEAIREGKSQEELANKPEHPVAVLQRIKNFESSINKTKEDLEALENDLELSKTKFSTYTDEERELANKELQSAIDNNLEVEVPEEKDMSLNEIRDKLMEELNVTEPEAVTDVPKLNDTVNQIKIKQDELEELHQLKSSLDKTKAPNVYNRLMTDITNCENEIEQLKKELTNSNMVNEYINSHYTNSPYSEWGSAVGFRPEWASPPTRGKCEALTESKTRARASETESPTRQKSDDEKQNTAEK